MRALVCVCLLCLALVGTEAPQAWRDQMRALQLEMIAKDVAYTRLLLDRSVDQETRQKRLQAFEKQRAQDFYKQAWPLLDVFPIFKDRKLPARTLKAFKSIALLLLWECLEDTRLTNLDYDPGESVYTDFLEPFYLFEDSIIPLLFSPLLASQLDPLDYVQSLPSLNNACAQGKCAYLKGLASALDFFYWATAVNNYHDHWGGDFHTSDEDMGLIVSLANALKGAWYLVQISKKHNPFLEEILNSDPSISLEAFKNYALLKGLFYLHNTPFYLQGFFQDEYSNFQDNYPEIPHFSTSYKNTHTRILNQPQLCLLPKYLSDKAKKACLGVLKSPPKSVLDSLRALLKQARLLSVDDVPCVYLNPKGEIQYLKSKNAICRALGALKNLH
ncbi:hypothetical protein ACFOPX_02840 [Helicobacter baculiformis]|uniref:Uncharacterized protein n=1 Tax=Helicobacter baculiformis TaxID=427351 RepID=A0ABV7ZIJ7_9HELI|nr:hypothetical protein [Helicobacter baculiformis]